jgi:hypothetical protein
MSNLNLPKKDIPWVNHEYSWFEVIEPEYGEDPTRAESVIALQHISGHTMTRELRFYRNILLNRIQKGDRFMSRDLRLNLVTVAGEVYVRVDNNPLSEDLF